MLLLPGKRFTTLNTIYHADAMDLLSNLPDNSVDMVLTDPPYGLGGRVFDVPEKNYSAVNESWDLEIPLDWLTLLPRILKPGANVVCFGVRQSTYATAARAFELGWRLVNDITWYKPDAPPNFTGRMLIESTERILWFCPDGAKWKYNLDFAKSVNMGMNFRDVWTYATPRDNRFHPTQKPLALITRLIKLLSNKGDLVLDPFMGSGTTAVAAIHTDRQFVGSELAKEYFDGAVKRIANVVHVDTIQPSLFGDKSA